jgi:inosine-uridine nucleoside N-ribohydrolase
VVITGPCTNLALTLKIFPDLSDYIEQVVMMGGALDKGNVTVHSEYNVWSDPEAADLLLRVHQLDVVMVGLEATH